MTTRPLGRRGAALERRAKLHVRAQPTLGGALPADNTGGRPEARRVTMHGVSRSLGFALHFATSTRGGAAPLRGPGDLRAMRKTRLADQRDDGHCMSANSAVTLMKEAVDSAIKHGDIRLDAVGGLTVSTERHRHAALTLRLLPCRLRRPSACPGNTCANGSTHGAHPSDERARREQAASS